ncbi:phage terminase small subunit-related protein [Paenibacillus polymyxa]|uniref:phage terminase small subunit-related protein n=1 Tax=Paenibacillus polymyxa TaxID=1406 RepID=UPI0025B68B83|nr:phage terminase small subunit-related protein [Paenibacillus polymyxa]MDN4086074.1 phage terminase small subunit-related protein [Paenibacillus polymyxa]MDN4108270.1 phage terminase small subunit-related protein [Paenibacillus polymyxa]
MEMPRERIPERDKARQMWLESSGAMRLKDIAVALSVPEKSGSQREVYEPLVGYFDYFLFLKKHYLQKNIIYKKILFSEDS